MRQDPAIPAPRPRDEAWMSLARWQELHAGHKARAAQGGADLLFLGDSITEAWPLEGGEAWRRHLEPLGALALGIGGDQTQHLLWRFELGEFEGLEPKAVVLLVGANNIGLQQDPPAEVLRGIQAVAARIRGRWPRARLLLHGLLPCGDRPEDPRTAATEAVNQGLKHWAQGQGLAYWDARELFLDAQGRPDLALLPDGLHPNAKAYARWAQALRPVVEGLLVPAS